MGCAAGCANSNVHEPDEPELKGSKGHITMAPMGPMAHGADGAQGTQGAQGAQAQDFRGSAAQDAPHQAQTAAKGRLSRAGI